MKCKLPALLIATLFIFLNAVNAQKFGHVNSAIIIEAHPKVAAANMELEAFQKSLIDPFTIKAQAFQDKYKTYLEETASGTLSKVAMEAKQAELATEQQALTTEEQQLQFQLLQKRETLLKPILAEVDSLIQTIGKEGNYAMIFDTSVAGALLYAVESEDLTETLKSRCMAKQ